MRGRTTTAAFVFTEKGHSMKTWNARKTAGDHQGLVIDEASGRNVAVTYDAADAPLVAAAPDLLDALDRLLRHCEGTNTAFYVTNKPAALREAFKGQKEAMQAARAALAKARGGA